MCLGLSETIICLTISSVVLNNDKSQYKIAILGGGPGGYEAALVAAHLGADVTIIERKGMGG